MKAVRGAWIGLGATVLLGLVIGFLVFQGGSDDPIEVATSLDYSSYEFSDDPKVIDFGVQPMYLPTNIITEAMSRDMILRDQLEERGVELRFHPFLKGSDVNEFVERGDLELAIGGDMPALTAIDCCDVTVLAQVQDGFTSIVSNGLVILSELEGKRIAYADGSNAHFALLNALDIAGIDVNSVDLIPVDVDMMPKMLEDGEVDAFSAWEPTPTIARAELDGDAFTVQRSLSSGFLYAAEPYYQEHTDDIDFILAAALRALNMLRADSHNVALATTSVIEYQGQLGLPNDSLDVAALSALLEEDILNSGKSMLFRREGMDDNSRLAQELSFLQSIDRVSRSATWSDYLNHFKESRITAIQSAPSAWRLNDFEYDWES